MKIPISFKIMGRTINVIDDARLLQDRSWCGSTDYDSDEIHISPRNDFYQASDAKIEQSFCHDLVHHLLYHSGGAINYDLKSGEYIHQNEEFVDLLASLIHQAFTTMEFYEEEKSDESIEYTKSD